MPRFFSREENPAHRLGRLGEKEAKRFVKKRGYKIIESNYRCSLGELDLIAQDGEYLVFIEVKTRTDRNPLLQMTRAKTERIRRLALVYIEEKQIRDLQPRFDVIAVTREGSELKVEHLENAF